MWSLWNDDPPRILIKVFVKLTAVKVGGKGTSEKSERCDWQILDRRLKAVVPMEAKHDKTNSTKSVVSMRCMQGFLKGFPSIQSTIPWQVARRDNMKYEM